MIHQIVAGMTLVEGIAFGVVAYAFYRRKQAKLARWRPASGEVIDVRLHSGRQGGSIRNPVIRYQATNGEMVTFESNYGSSSWKVKTGDRLAILVNPDKPTEAEVVGFMPQYALVVVFGIISASLLIAAPILYVFLKK